MLHGLHNILSYIFFLYFHDILYIFSLLALSARRLLEYPRRGGGGGERNVFNIFSKKKVEKNFMLKRV